MQKRYVSRYGALALCCLLACPVHAAPPPDPKLIGPADVSRVKPDTNELAPLPDVQAPVAFPQTSPDIPIPEGAKKIQFVLHKVVIEGATAFKPEELADIYQPYIDKDVSLEVAYKIAAEITRRYRDEGYFLTLTTVPDQRIEGGVLTLKVTEGYIGEVDYANSDADYYVIDQLIERVKAQKPLKSSTLEAFLLQMNDIPGYSFRAVLSQLDTQSDGGVKLTLVPIEKKGAGFISFDNFNSRYLGPQEATASYSTSLIPFQQTTVSFDNSAPLDRLHYGSITQLIPIFADINLELSAGDTRVEPGYTLAPLEVVSNSNTLSVGLDYQAIRQRQENLAASLRLDSRNTTSDTLGVQITNDKVRALRAGLNFDTSDAWRGYSTAKVLLSQGIDGLGSSKAGEFDLSRALAKPDFTKVEFSLSRLQGITDDWSMQLSGSAQIADGSLYSSEQFGYGGQQYGRAFDASELIGDEGFDASAELRYGGFADLEPIALQPFGFYDFGLVTNQDPSQPKRLTGASIGAGFRFSTPWNQSGNLTAAYPLIRDEATPIYGMSNQGPRISFQLTQSF